MKILVIVDEHRVLGDIVLVLSAMNSRSSLLRTRLRKCFSTSWL